MIDIIFAVFAIAGLLLFRVVAPVRAVAITCFAGWLLLPVGNFPPGSADAIFPFWITGAAVPSYMLLTKMWVPPVVAFLGALWTDRQTVLGGRPGWIDLPIALWCLWPVGQWPFVASPDPSPLIASLYLIGSWGTPWLLGRLYFCGPDGGRRLLTAITAGLTVIAPIALVESIIGPRVYGWLYDLHPFRFDGQERYIGFRPLAFFENGNQYGIWVAATALAAVWLWRAERHWRARHAAIAVLSLLIALMSQSAGAVLILFAGLALLYTAGWKLTRWLLPLVLLFAALAGALYWSGKIPVRAIAENTAVGREIVHFARATGRGSLTWRIARDQNALPVIRAHPIVGNGRWDWWKPIGERPWDLPLMLIGQFGLVGLLLAYGSLIVPIIYALAQRPRIIADRLQPAPALTIIVLMAIADSLSNSFVFYPALLAAGALAAHADDTVYLLHRRTD